MNTQLEISLLTDYLERFWKIILDYSPRLVTALVILFIGLYIIRLINRLVRRVMVSREVDPTLSEFAADILL